VAAMAEVYRTARGAAIPRGELRSRTRRSKVMAMLTTTPHLPALGLPERYMAVWNEPSPEARRALVERLWTPDGRQVLDPPEAIRDEAARVGFPNATLVVRGHDELTARVTRAYEEFVAPGEFRFVVRDDARLLGDLLTFSWEMITVADGRRAGGGTDIMLLSADGRIETAYQLIDRQQPFSASGDRP
jgi:hypothetical protein